VFNGRAGFPSRKRVGLNPTAVCSDDPVEESELGIAAIHDVEAIRFEGAFENSSFIAIAAPDKRDTASHFPFQDLSLYLISLRGCGQLAKVCLVGAKEFVLVQQFLYWLQIHNSLFDDTHWHGYFRSAQSNR